MALVKQTKEIPFLGGIGQDVDEKLLPDGRMLELRDCYYHKPGDLRKRLGSKSVTKRIQGGADIENGRSILSHGNELLAMDGTDGYSWSSHGSGSWVDKGKAPRISVSTSRVAGSLLGNENHYSWDGAAFGDLAVYAYGGPHAITSTVKPVYATVVDLSTGVELISNEELDTEGAYCHVISVPGVLVGVVWLNSTTGEIYWKELENIGTPDIAFGSRVNITAVATNADVTADYQIAAQPLTPAAVLGGTGYTWALVYRATVTGFLVVVRVARDGTVVATTNVAVSPERIWLAINRSNLESPDIWPIFSETAAGQTSLKMKKFDLSGSAGGTVTVESFTGGAPGPTPIRAAAVEDISTPSSMRVYYVKQPEIGPGSYPTGMSDTRTALVTTVGGVSGVGSHLGGVALFSDPFTENGKHYYFATHLYDFDDIPATAFLVDSDGAVVARFSVRESHPGFFGGWYMVRRVSSLGDGRWLVSSLRTIAESLEVKSAGDTQVCDLISVVVDLRDSGRADTVVANESLYTRGGYLIGYDRSQFYEAGFHYGPGRLISVGGGAGAIANGDYNVQACFFWRDDEGNEFFSELMRQTSSLPVTIAGGGINVTLQTYRATALADVKILIYRTLLGALAGPYYLAGFLDNDTTVESLSTTLTLADASIGDNVILYTNNGVLENVAPPCPHFIWDDGQTAYLIASDDRRSLWVSKPISSRLGIEWSDSIITRMPTGEELEAGGSIDGNVVLFGRRSIRVLLGSRPTATGLGGYTDTRPVSSEVGCIDRRSVVQFRGGFVFKSHRGIEMLSRSFEVQYIGGPVENFNDEAILDTVVITRPGIGQIRFLLESGTVLVWDYLAPNNTWSVLNEPQAVSCADWRTHYASVDASGRVRHKLDRGHFLDDDERFKWGFRIPWVKVAGFNGYQRTKRTLLLGEHRSSYSMDVDIYNDYKGRAPSQSVTIESDGEVAGSPLQARIRNAKQKSSAISVDVTIDAKDEGVRMTGISLEIGAKKGQSKLSKEQSK